MATTAPQTELEIINNAYYILEQDNAGWDVESSEYLTARGLLQGAIGRWEFYDNVRWRELWGTLTDAPDGDKNTDSSTNDYLCPSDMRYPASWVRTVGANNARVFWTVIAPEDIAGRINDTGNWCYFTGNISLGFTLHFNPNVTLTDNDTIEYEYYRQADKTEAVTDTIDMQDPWFGAYFIAAHMADGGLDTDFMNMAETRLDQMKMANMAGLELVPDPVPTDTFSEGGFGV
jgi:hypothetical protein